jgi:zinc-ribbon domain
MFCPRCGQQAAEGIRFCSRCGLPLAAAAELVEAGGELARPDAVGLTQRQRGTRKGLTIAVGGLLFFGVAALLTAYRDELFPLLILAGILITVGVMRLLYGLLLEEHAPAKELSKRRAELPGEPARATELPPARAVPANVYARPGAQTSDMAAPNSVTESTTKLLDEDGMRPRRENL